jgi:bifunctional N-acetylglucosamine-1-phosphate-uridyltransferase/glucosamine-1-phosphate-acetyltransferase GlmU-like protein
MLDAQSFFALTDFIHAGVFARTIRVWDALANLKPYMQNATGALPEDSRLASGIPLAEPLVLFEGRLFPGRDCEISYGDVIRGGLKVRREGQELPGATVLMAGAVFLGRRIELGRGVLVEPGAMIKEPAIIGDHTEVRQGAYLRGYCLIGQRCVVGHTTEVKHSIFLNDAKAGHFAYVGDSILGGEVNLGAGTKLANFRFLPGEVQVKTPDGVLGSGLRKFGAIFGDRVQTGCNSVTSPGALVGQDGIIMPNTTVRSGYHPARCMLR